MASDYFWLANMAVFKLSLNLYHPNFHVYRWGWGNNKPSMLDLVNICRGPKYGYEWRCPKSFVWHQQIISSVFRGPCYQVELLLHQRQGILRKGKSAKAYFGGHFFKVFSHDILTLWFSNGFGGSISMSHQY